MRRTPRVMGTPGRVLAAIAVLLLAVAGRASAQEQVEYYGTDAVGSVRVVFNADGTVKGRMDYGPFGARLIPATAMPPEGFGGQTTDAESGQGYFHARQLHARTGRFASTDPIYDGLFDPQRWNRYAYAGNNPVANVDPLGLNAAFTGTSVPGCWQFGL